MEVQPTVDSSHLRRHLNDCHHHLADQILSVYPKMKNLLKDVQSDVFSHKNEEEGKNDTTLSIENFFSTKTMTTRDVQNIQIVQDVQREEEKDGLNVIDLTDSNCQPSTKQYSIPRNGLSIAERRQIKRVLTTVALGIPLTWSRKLNQVNEKIVNDLELILCPYDSMREGLKRLRERMQRCIAQYLQQFDYINFCCDGWSVMKPDISMECLFACVFHNNRFQSILCKCFHVEESTAENLRIGVREVINEFNLSENCFITTDGGTNMVAAFKENRAPCNCHAINTVIRHMGEGKWKKDEIKYGLTRKEAKCIARHFNQVKAINSKVRGKRRKEFKGWIDEMGDVNLDFDKNIPMPETVSPTRWECMAIQMRWLVRYGHLLHRYVLSNAEIGSQFPNLITTLHTLEETI